MSPGLQLIVLAAFVVVLIAAVLWVIAVFREPNDNNGKTIP